MPPDGAIRAEAICERCGAAGTVRHAPAAVPVSGIWCDRCYRVVRRQMLLMRYALPALIVLAGVLTALLRRR